MAESNIRKLRAIRRLARSFPVASAELRLTQIADIVSGKLEPGAIRPVLSKDLAKRLKEGQESRSPMSAPNQHRLQKEQKKREQDVKDVQKSDDPDEKKRAKRGGRDRQERGGMDRVTKSTDTNR